MNASEASQAAVVDVLRRNPVFRRVGDRRLRVVALCGEVQRLPAGETLFEHGEEGDAAYVVLSGAVLAQLPTPAGPQTVARMEPGELFGEIAVLCDRPRTASIVADADTMILRLSAEDLRALVAEFPELSAELLRSLAERLETTSRALAEMRARRQ